jgi:hypothetical protein
VVVAAHSLGLGSCYVGDIVEQRERVTELLDLDKFVFPAAMLTLGYPTKQQLGRSKPVRFNREFIVVKDRYRRLTEAEHRRMFERRGQDFDRFVAGVCRRKYMSQFAAEMTRSVRLYLDQFRVED